MTPDWREVGEWTAVDRPEYVCDLTEYRRGEEQMVFIHLKMRKWTKSALKQALDDFKLLREFVACPLYACGEVDDDKWSHFVSLFGFKFLTEALCTDGNRRRVFINIKGTAKNVQQQTTAATEFKQRTVDGAAAVPVNSVQ